MALKKNCCSAVVSPSPAARPPVNVSLTLVYKTARLLRLTTCEKAWTGTIIDVASTIYTGELLAGHNECTATIGNVVVLAL